MWNDAIIDRRSGPRWPSAGVAIVRMRGAMVRSRIMDLGTGGVRLRVESQVGMADLCGREVGVELRLDTPGTAWLYLRGRVIRISAALLTVVIAFDNVPAGFADVVGREDRGAGVD